MHLNEIDNKVNAQKVAQLLKENFGLVLNVKTLSIAKADKLLEAVRGKIHAIKHSSQYHVAEKSPRFMSMIMLEQTLSKWKNEKLAEAKPKKGVNPFAKKDDEKAEKKGDKKDAKKDEKPKKGVNPFAKKDAKAVKEGRAPVTETIVRAKYLMMEGEVESAEAILAGQDLVDRFQKMLEDLSKMQNEELPPLGSTIRDNLSAEQSTAFIGSATEAISAALEAVRTARETLDVAVRTMAGEQVDTGMDAGMDAGLDAGSAAGDEFGVEAPPVPGGADAGLDADLGAEGGDAFGATPPAIGGDEPLGRGRREEA